MPTIFEQIVSGDIPGRIVHETETTLAFLDANPLARGHTLVIPKEPYEHLDDMPAEIASDVFGVVNELTPVIENAVDADATTVGMNNGEAAGQEVTHAHAHIIPRFDGDGGGPIHAVSPNRPELSEEELNEIEAAINNA